jgi:cytochrome o ubiquinol oxidase subunit 1
MPKDTGTGVILAGLSVVFAVAMVWYMWWLAVLSLVAIIGVAIWHTFNYDRDYYIPAEDVARIEDERTRLLQNATLRNPDSPRDQDRPSFGAGPAAPAEA